MVGERSDYTEDIVSAARSVLLELVRVLGEYRIAAKFASPYHVGPRFTTDFDDLTDPDDRNLRQRGAFERMEYLWSVQMPEPDTLLTATEAAELLGVQRTHVYWLIDRGELLDYDLPTKDQVRPGRLYVPRGEVLALKERRATRRDNLRALDTPIKE